MDALTLNRQLRTLYTSRLPEIYSTIVSNKDNIDLAEVSGPFMMHVFPEYTLADKKLLFVGMETHTWEKINPNEAIEATYKRLTERYFSFISNQEYPNSPFWWFIKDLSRQFKTQDWAKSILWTNLSKIDVCGKRPTGKLYDNSMQLFLSLLSDEISIIKPDFVILMTTDPNYNWHIKEYYSTKINEMNYREEKIKSCLFKIKSSLLPANTYQMCHPNRLRFMRGGFTENANGIIQVISKEDS